MKDKQTLLALIQAKEWERIVSSYIPEEVCAMMTFKETMRLARSLYSFELSDEALNFAAELMFACSKFFPKEWNADWKHDVYLGNLCSMIWRYEDMCRLFKRAYDRVENPPSSLLLLLAGTIFCPPDESSMSVSQEEARQLVERAWAMKQTSNAAIKMRYFAREDGDIQAAHEWTKICDDLEHVLEPAVIPDIFKEECFC